MLKKIHSLVADALLWLIKPSLAPMLGDIYITQQQLKKRKIEWEDVIVGPGGELRKADGGVKVISKGGEA